MSWRYFCWSPTTGIAGRPAFAGFASAVVTVAAVLAVSRADERRRIDIWRNCLGAEERPAAQVGALTSLVALFSAFMNNVGALALLMPVAIRMAQWPFAVAPADAVGVRRRRVDDADGRPISSSPLSNR